MLGRSSPPLDFSQAVGPDRVLKNPLAVLSFAFCHPEPFAFCPSERKPRISTPRLRPTANRGNVDREATAKKSFGSFTQNKLPFPGFVL